MGDFAPQEGDIVTMMGWGRQDTFEGELSEVLMTVDQPVSNLEDCDTHFTNLFLPTGLPDNYFCADSETGGICLVYSIIN